MLKIFVNLYKLKNMKKNLIILTIITVQFLSAQSPWTREKGKAFVQIGLTSLSYEKYRKNGIDVNDDHNYNDMTVQAYTEYGITNNLEATLILPYKYVGFNSSVSHHKESLSGLGNLTAGLKYKFYDKTWKISGGMNIVFNSISTHSVEKLTTGFNANTFLPYLTIGSSKDKWYNYGNIGYGYMDNNYSDYIKSTIEVGYEIIEKGHLIFVIDSRNIVKNESAFINEKKQWASYLDRQNYNAIGIKGNYEFQKDKYGANFAIFGATNIDNAPLAPTLNLGFYAKL